jgi:hypothetical protein
MSALTTTPFVRLDAALRDLGYKPGAPRHVHAECVEIDRQVAAEADCDCCGRHGLDAHAYGHGRSYRVVASCPACEHAVEM